MHVSVLCFIGEDCWINEGTREILDMGIEDGLTGEEDSHQGCVIYIIHDDIVCVCVILKVITSAFDHAGSWLSWSGLCNQTNSNSLISQMLFIRGALLVFSSQVSPADTRGRTRSRCFLFCDPCRSSSWSRGGPFYTCYVLLAAVQVIMSQLKLEIHAKYK